MNRGRLRLYLGVASGVGTTYAMLDEALRRKRRGTEVAVGWVDAHQRPVTLELLEQVTGSTALPTFLDVETVISQRPDVVIVDELGRRVNTVGGESFHWQQVEHILDAGIDVVGTITARDIAPLTPLIAEVLGSEDPGCIPESFLKRAEQIEFVDITPEAIRRRIAHGNVFAQGDVESADVELFNSRSFAVLRSLTVGWLADRLSTELGIERTEDKIVVLLGGKDDPVLLARAHRIAQRTRAEIIGLRINRGSPREEDSSRQRLKNLVEDFGGTYNEVIGKDVPGTLLDFAATHNASQILTGHGWSDSRLGRLAFSDTVVPDGGISARRRQIGFAVAITILSVMTSLLVANRGALSVATSLSLYLLAVVFITAVGGSWPGLVSAIAAPLLANWFLIPPFHTFRITKAENILELLVFISVASLVSAFVALAARRAVEAKSAWREATSLAKLNQVEGRNPVDGIMSLMADTFQLRDVAIFASDDLAAEVRAHHGDGSMHSARDSDFSFEIGNGWMLAARGPTLSVDDRRLLSAFVGQLAIAVEQQLLRDIATEAEALAKADELRTAILRAVSHDLRSPLASIKASVSSLRQSDIEWPPDVRADFLLAIESETDRLTAIVTNLLDLSRIEAGVLRPVLRQVSLDEVLSTSVNSARDSSRIGLVVAEDLPDFVADPALLDRVLANVIDNALTWSPTDEDVTIQAFRTGDHVHIHVVDRGPGIPPSDRSHVLQPFHRLDDSSRSGGLGLGLAIADRLISASGGTLELRDTPGGGLTVAMTLPCVEESS